MRDGGDVTSFPGRGGGDESRRFRVRPFTLNYARSRALPTMVTPYRFDESLQLTATPGP
ncbi:hypothetical protein [Streptomyces sp. DT2A-34]|uniref:hypothetical protein n=1 Tax=Streptomyces sp. DT2A-34 TaxID=3051182 RepID=UPI003464BEB3